jgi:ABC-2 type transport system permease protein
MMKNLLYKELQLVLHPLFYLVPLLCALILIPSWLYFIAISYVFFITITNLFATSKAQNDIRFSVMLPVRKKDIVKARFYTVIFVELLQLITAVIFGIINQRLYTRDNFLLEPNAAFFGFVFIMYAIFNGIFLPMFYKTGHKIGWPAILSTGVAILFAAAVELFALLVPFAKQALDSDQSDMVVYKIIVLFVGAIIFVLSNMLAYKVSAKRFEMIDV